MLPAYTLAEAAAAITACLEANASADVDRIGRHQLDALEERLRGWLSIARSSRAPAWFFGGNWNGPALADVIRQCEVARRPSHPSRKVA